MACYHCAVKVLTRSAGRSSVQFSAYISGEKMKDERLGESFNHTSKEEVCYTEFRFADRVPEEIRTPEKFWNAVEKFEKSEKAQVCRTWEIALPKELTEDQNILWVNNYVNDLIEKDHMPAVQWAIHDKEGNPHAHIMAPMRDIDEKGQFKIKTKKEYVLDEEGQRVPVLDQAKLEQYEQNHGHPFSMEQLKGLSAEERQPILDEVQKMRVREGKGAERQWQRVTTEYNPWNSKEMMVQWRERAATHQNKALKLAQWDERVDHRSYETQGIERIPTIHEGYEARKMGDKSERVQLNNQIRAINQEYEHQMTLMQTMQNQWQEFLRSLEHVRDQIRERIARIGRNIEQRADGQSAWLDRNDYLREELHRIRDDGDHSASARTDRNAERERLRAEREQAVERASRPKISRSRSHDIEIG